MKKGEPALLAGRRVVAFVAEEVLFRKSGYGPMIDVCKISHLGLRDNWMSAETLGFVSSNSKIRRKIPFNQQCLMKTSNSNKIEYNQRTGKVKGSLPANWCKMDASVKRTSLNQSKKSRKFSHQYSYSISQHF